MGTFLMSLGSPQEKGHIYVVCRYVKRQMEQQMGKKEN
jgi:hypothetical protein